MDAGEPDSKLEVAKRSLFELIGDLPPGQEVTLVTYPSGSMQIEGCNAGAVRAGPSTGDRSSLAAAVRAMRADGDTPTGPTLQHVIELFKRSGHQTGSVVLISDGLANCGDTDVCEVGRQMASIGLNLTVNTVRLDISEEEGHQLRCVADATGGISVGADDADLLAQSLQFAARGALSLDVSAPSSVQTVTGGASTADARVSRNSNTVIATLSAVGANPSEDVRLHFTLRDRSGANVSRFVAQPTRYVGNLTRGPSRQLHFQIRPLSGVEGPLTYELRAWGHNSAPVVKTGTLAVVDSADRATAGPIFRDARHAVIMGDSYSSGEGAGDYEGQDDRSSALWRCHRSPHTYARSLFDRMPSPGGTARQVTQLACSGATTSDVYRYQHLPGIEPQLKELRRLADSESPPDLVLLTLGGNDVGFGALVQGCVVNGVLWSGGNYLTYRPCGRDDTDELSGSPRLDQPLPWTVSGSLTNRTLSNLEGVYSDVDLILNRADVVARRDGRVAQIVVLPYVNPIPAYDAARNGCFLGLSKTEMLVAQRFLDTLNTVLAVAVSNAADRGTPVYFAKPVEDAFQSGHTICDNPPAVRVDGVAGKATDEALGGDEFGKVQELMHPTRDGYALIASTLVEWSRPVDVDWTSDHRVNLRQVKVEGPFQATYRRVIGALDVPRLPEGYATMPLACDKIFATAQCEQVTATKYGLVNLFSTPTPLAFVHGNDPDRMFDGVHWPGDIPPGRHLMTFDGVDGDGNPVHLEATVVIHPPGTTRGLALSGVGLILILGGTLWWWRQRRSSGSTHPTTQHTGE